MPQVKAANPKEIFSRAEWQHLTRISRWRGIALIIHAWAMVALITGGTAWLLQWSWIAGLAVTPLALLLLGGRQLGLAILMHEAAHGVTHPNRRVNNILGDWFAGAATGADLQSYRAYHLTHHRYTQQNEDPDLPLSAPFPVTQASLRRKIIRDLTGQTALKQRSAQIAIAIQGIGALLSRKADAAPGKRDTHAATPFNRTGPKVPKDDALRNGIGAPMDDRSGAIAMAKTVGRFLLVQFILLALSLLSGLGLLPWLLWLLALVTSFQMVLRIRNIAEHACTPTGSEDPFSHARTTRANWLERAIVAPYWVNYHAEHHLFMGLPSYRLKTAHNMLVEKGFAPRMTIAPDYHHVINLVTAQPESA